MIYVMTHKRFTPPPDPFYVPLQVGRKGQEDLGYLRDDLGENISEQNPFYSELTGMYWVWKNRPEDDIVGICHYRRFLLNERGALFTEGELQDLLTQADVITTKRLTLRDTYFHAFHGRHNNQDLLLCRESIRSLCPEYLSDFDATIHDVHTYFGNMMILRGDLFRAYAAWLFPILFETQKSVCMDGYDNYQKRLYGFLSEILLYVYMKKNRLRVRECMVGMLGEKAETRELKEKLGRCFARSDYQGAKACFLKEYARRPDILMEASDTFGELKLSMQIISTCEYEQERYGKTLLEDASCADFEELLRHFSRINELVCRAAKKGLPEVDKRYLRDYHVTEECVRIACRVMDVDEKIILDELSFL